MRRRRNILIFSLVLSGVLLIIQAGCKKKDSGENPAPAPVTITDIDGNIYHKVTIGTQVWMVENLKAIHFRNGDLVSNIINDGTWAVQSTEGYCDYGTNQNNSATYGRLYNWYAVNDSRKLAPLGWHIPTEAELTTLINYEGGNTADGGKLKESGTTHWQSPNTDASNSSGFTALPGGSRDTYGAFDNLNYHSYLWSATEFNSSMARMYHLYYDFGGSQLQTFSKVYGFSVRCVKD
jgi:uncharacterized protein (TIGR02145 family)